MRNGLSGRKEERRQGDKIRRWCNRPGENWLNNLSFPNTYACGLHPKRTRKEKKRHNQTAVIYLWVFLAVVRGCFGIKVVPLKELPRCPACLPEACFPDHSRDLLLILGPGFSLLRISGDKACRFLDFDAVFLWQHSLPGACLEHCCFFCFQVPRLHRTHARSFQPLAPACR